MRRAVLLAALLVLAYPMAAAQASAPDVMVVSIRVLGVPAWSSGTPSTVRLEADVHNGGNAQASYTLTWEWQKDGHVEPLAQTAAGSTDGGTVAPGETRTHGIDWTLGPGQEGDGVLRATAAAPADSRHANDRATKGVHVARHDVRMAWTDSTLELRTDETRYAALSIDNHGLDAETLHLVRPEGTGPAYQVRLHPESITVAAGRSATALAVVTMPFQPDLPPAADVRLLLEDAITASAAWSPYLHLEPVTASLEPGDLATKLSAEPPPRPQPGKPFTIEARLENTGKEPDSFAISAQGADGWALDPVPAWIALEPGTSSTFVVQANIYTAPMPGSTTDVMLTARSDRARAGDATLMLPVTTSGPTMSFKQVDVPDPLYRGEPLQVGVVLENTGTAQAPSGTMRIESAPPLPGLPLSVVVPAVAAGRSWSKGVDLTAAMNDAHFLKAGFAWLDVDKDGILDADERVYVAQRPDVAGSGGPAGYGSLSAGDIRIIPMIGAEPGSRVGASPDKSNPDAGAGPLTRFREAALACVDADDDRKCGPDEDLVLNATLDHLLAPDDVYLTAGHAPPYLGPVLAVKVGLPGGETFADADGDRAFGPADAIYFQAPAALAGRVPGILRLTPFINVPGGRLVADGDIDRPAQRDPSPHTVACWHDQDSDGEVDVGEGVFLLRGSCGSRSVLAGDVRLARDDALAAGPPVPAPGVVRTNDADLSLSTIPIPAGSAYYVVDRNGDGKASDDDEWVLHLGSGTMEVPGDVVLSGRLAGQVVPGPPVHPGAVHPALGDPSLGLPLARAGLENATLAFADGNGDGLLGLASQRGPDSRTAPDLAFLDVDGDLRSGAGDIRLQCLPVARPGVATPSCGPRASAFGSRVRTGDADEGLALRRLGVSVLDDFLGDIRLTLSWTPDSPVPDATAEATARIRDPGLHLTAPEAVSAFPGSLVDYDVPPAAFELRNDGNTVEEVHLELTAHQGNATLLVPDLLSLAPGESVIVGVRHRLPIPAQPGPSPLALSAWLSGHPATRVEARLDVDVVDLADPDVAWTSVPKEWDEGRPVPFLLTATDDTGIGRVVVRIQGPAGETVAEALQTAPGRYAMDVPLALGSYEAVAEATDLANHTRITATRSFQVARIQGPRLVVLDPAPNSTVRGPFALTVSIEDTRAPLQGELAVDGGTPVPLDVSGSTGVAHLAALAPGHHLVRIVVQNAAGRNTTIDLPLDGPVAPTDPVKAGHSSPGGGLHAVLLGIAAALTGRRQRGQRRGK